MLTHFTIMFNLRLHLPLFYDIPFQKCIVYILFHALIAPTRFPVPHLPRFLRLDCCWEGQFVHRQHMSQADRLQLKQIIGITPQFVHHNLWRYIERLENLRSP